MTVRWVRALTNGLCPKLLTQLLDAGSITPNTKDSEDCTLLQWAAINNRKIIIQELVVGPQVLIQPVLLVVGQFIFAVCVAQDRGGDVNATGGFLKETALQWAVRQGALEVAASCPLSIGEWHDGTLLS